MTLDVYRTTTAFPPEEAFGLTRQSRRSARSIGANLAESCGRGSDRDFARFVQVALGSASELEYHVLLAYDLGFVSTADQERLLVSIAETKRMLTGLFRRLTKSTHRS